MKNIILPIIALAILLTACTKKIPYYPIVPGLRANFNYKPGSYWIYRDSISGRRDSFVVNYYSYSPHYNEGTADFEQLYFDVSEFNTADVLSPDSSVWSWQIVKNWIVISASLDYPNASSENYTPLLVYPFLNERVNNIDTATVYPKINWGGTSYANVAVVSVVDTIEPSEYINDRFYITDSIGIIGIVLDHPFYHVKRVWQLESYHIIH